MESKSQERENLPLQHCAPDKVPKGGQPSAEKGCKPKLQVPGATWDPAQDMETEMKKSGDPPHMYVLITIGHALLLYGCGEAVNVKIIHP